MVGFLELGGFSVSVATGYLGLFTTSSFGGLLDERDRLCLCVGLSDRIFLPNPRRRCSVEVSAADLDTMLTGIVDQMQGCLL